MKINQILQNIQDTVKHITANQMHFIWQVVTINYTHNTTIWHWKSQCSQTWL